MERTTGTTPSYSMLDPQATDRGVGGKLRRQPPRRPPTTPYSRPQQNQSLCGRFLSKLVDPTYRLIAGGATRIFPSLFSKHLTNDSLPLPEPQTNETVNLNEDREEHPNGEHKTSSTFGVLQTAGTSGSTDGSKDGSDFAEKRKGVKDDGLSEIEKLMEGKTFSRNEINRLIEIINSRAVDVPKVDQERKDLVLSARGAKDPIVSHNLGRPTEEKQDDSNKAVWDLPTPLPKPTPNETGCSPIEIAKAYMAVWKPEINLGSKSIISKDKRPTVLSDDYASEPLVPLPSPKSSTRWPGSMIKDQYGYLTPHSQRGRFGLHNIRRTPYSRTIYSKSKLKRAQTPIYGQLKSDIADHGHRSLGPIRRIRHDGTTEAQSRGSAYSHSSLKGSFPVGNSIVSKSVVSSMKNKLEQGGASSSSVFQSVDSNRRSEVNIPPVCPHSCQMARTIFEHLERNLVTPKEKSEELKIATSSKISQSSDVNANSLPYLGLDYSKRKDKIDNRSPAQGNEHKGNSFSVTVFSNNGGPSIDFGKAQDSRIKTAHKDHLRVTGAPEKPLKSFGNKPVLASISVSKPEQRWMFTLDNSTGLPFPVSASSVPSSEPPTPSIMPSLPGSSLHLVRKELSGPLYSFGGSSRLFPSLVFSFPSTSNVPNNVDASDIKFNFESDRRAESSHQPDFKHLEKTLPVRESFKTKESNIGCGGKRSIVSQGFAKQEVK
ncbi:hypothetical protein V6N12_008349 [Hibiscus sabdariffa]|uniref:Nuclear pore complex protein NUP1 n=1 Tax=Hibiscus sabdariffa TaxID=183260 RepID=A0ABR2B3E4_9ROSI